METLKWAKPQITQEFANCRTLSECISTIEKRLEKQRKVLCKIRVNELLLQEQDEKKFGPTAIEDIDVLEIEFRDSQFLLQDTLASFVRWIDQVSKSVIRLAEQYRLEGRLADSYGFAKVIGDTQWLIEALQVIRSHLPETSEWQECETKLMSTLKELEDAYRRQDVIQIADVLEYELTSSLDQWREWMLKAVDSRVR